MQAWGFALLALASLVSPASRPCINCCPVTEEALDAYSQVLAEQQLEQGVYDSRGDW
jgi:hypothetical protein